MDLALDKDTWDLVIADRDLAVVTGESAIVQHLAQRLKTWLGEWFRDQRKGVPYLQHVLVKNPDPVVLDGVFKSAIINTPGIVELTFFDLSVERRTRRLKLTFTATSESGEQISFDEVLP